MSRLDLLVLRWKGPFAVLLSALLFYLATYFVKVGSRGLSGETFIFLFSRFALGYLAVLAGIKLGREPLVVVNRKWLHYRAFWNTIAVFFFYLGVVYGSVTGANILNMTYPAFVAILSIWLLSEKVSLSAWAGIVLAIVGAVMISMKNGVYNPSYGDVFSLVSGVTAGMAVTALRKIRLTDSTTAALFYNFRFGFWATSVFVVWFFWHHHTVVTLESLQWYLYSALSGFGGQIALTWGFRYVEAVHGSILSATRVLFALLFGVTFLGEEITFNSGAGAFLVLGANVILAYRKKGKRES